MLKKYFTKKFFDVYNLKFILLVLVFAALDIVTKYLVTANLKYHESADILGEILRFTLVYNTGGIFGTFSGNLIPSTVIMFFAISLLVLLYWKENDNLGTKYAWMLVMGGALGNFVDKLFTKSEEGWFFIFFNSDGARQGVVDFIDVDMPDFFGIPRWFTFNLADMYISIGVGLLILSMYKMRKKSHPPGPETAK